MSNYTTYSLEEVTMSPDGHAVHPVICNTCQQAIVQEPKRRSTPSSYAAVAEDQYTYQILDWKGLGTEACRCCQSRAYGQRWIVEPLRKQCVK